MNYVLLNEEELYSITGGAWQDKVIGTVAVATGVFAVAASVIVAPLNPAAGVALFYAGNSTIAIGAGAIATK